MQLKGLIIAFVIAALPVAVLAQAATKSPNELVAEAAKQLDQALSERKEELSADKDALYDLINEILLPRFDRKYAAQLVLGRHWRTASAQQRERFIEAFYGSLLRRYADGVLDFDLSQIEIQPFRGNLSDPRLTVRTTVTLEDGTEVPVDYAMVQRDEGWLLFDVVIEGISYVRNFRAELNSEIQAKSLDAVIKRLESEARGSGGGEGPSE
jgi:phospholipid transport system substrate-binding protein